VLLIPNPGKSLKGVGAGSKPARSVPYKFFLQKTRHQPGTKLAHYILSVANTATAHVQAV
jgi:hypothetical protein